IAAPMPRLAPVTSAVRPARELVMGPVWQRQDRRSYRVRGDDRGSGDDAAGGRAGAGARGRAPRARRRGLRRADRVDHGSCDRAGHPAQHRGDRARAGRLADPGPRGPGAPGARRPRREGAVARLPHHARAHRGRAGPDVRVPQPRRALGRGRGRAPPHRGRRRGADGGARHRARLLRRRRVRRLRRARGARPPLPRAAAAHRRQRRRARGVRAHPLPPAPVPVRLRRLHGPGLGRRAPCDRRGGRRRRPRGRPVRDDRAPARGPRPHRPLPDLRQQGHPMITELAAVDVRFPTSLHLDGSDAMNPDPDYSAAYLTLRDDDGPDGVSLVFTIGRGNDVVVAALDALRHDVVGGEVRTVDDVNALSRDLVGDSQLRWLGPEKGVMHMAIGGVVDAAWDLLARREGKPLWLLLAELTPEQLVSCIDFRYLTDAITPEQALALLTERAEGKAERIAHLREHGFPAYTTTPGWLGYDDEKLVRLSREAVADGFDMIKLKVGADLDEDVRRLRLAREAVGPDVLVAVDANQRWDVADAIAWMTALAPFDPYWIEEPTSPDDVLGHAQIRTGLREAGTAIKVATGEHCQNRVVAKQ